MSKYIELGKVKERVFNADMSMTETEALYKSLDNLPTIDIVRCKDCKHWHEWENGTGSCHRSDIMWVGSDYDDFCSFAERMESDTE